MNPTIERKGDVLSERRKALKQMASYFRTIVNAYEYTDQQAREQTQRVLQDMATEATLSNEETRRTLEEELAACKEVLAQTSPKGILYCQMKAASEIADKLAEKALMASVDYIISLPDPLDKILQPRSRIAQNN